MSTSAAAAGGKDSDPRISTVAGTGEAGFKGENAPAASAQLKFPRGIAVDSNGTVYFSDGGNHRVRKITTDGRISTVAGTGTSGFGGDGGPATAAQLKDPREVAVDSEGAVYIADQGNHRVRKVTADGKISTFAGSGTANFGGDGGLAIDALLNKPYGLTVDSTGAVYIADYGNHRIRKVTADGKISTVVGTGAAGYAGDGGPAVLAQLSSPDCLAIDSTDTLYLVNGRRIRKVTPDGKISAVAGAGTSGFGGDGGPATVALVTPLGIVTDSSGTLYIADYGNHRVRKVTADGNIGTVTGTDQAGFSGDDGPGPAAQLNSPVGVAVDCVGTLYITDRDNHRIRKIPAAKLGLPDSGTVTSLVNVRSKLRIGVARESVKDGAEIHQSLAAPKDHQRWKFVVAAQEDGEALYTIENVRSGKVLEVVGAHPADGAVIAQRAYEGDDARHQQWRLIPMNSADSAPRVFEIANRNSGLLLRVESNAPAAVKQHGSQGDPRNRQWQLLPV